MPTQEAADNSSYKSNELSINKNWHCWIRTPDAGMYFPHRVRTVDVSNTIAERNAMTTL